MKSYMESTTICIVLFCRKMRDLEIELNFSLPVLYNMKGNFLGFAIIIVEKREVVKTAKGLRVYLKPVFQT